MMDFISVPLVVGIVFGGIYKLFELFVCRSERLKVIDKLGESVPAVDLIGRVNLSGSRQTGFSFAALKGGCLMIGVGLGLIIGFIICLNSLPAYLHNPDNWGSREAAGIVYGACVLIFGGLGLLIAFLIELFVNRKRELKG